GRPPDRDLVGEDREARGQDRGARVRWRRSRAGRAQRPDDGHPGAIAAQTRSGRMTSALVRPRASFGETLAVYLRPRVLIVLFLGFSAGLPLALSSSTLLVWMREVGVDLGVIGLFALVGTPYTIKFLWAPVVDALDVPVLSPLFGRRRGWLFFSQLLLIVSIALLAFCAPAVSPWYVVFTAAVFVATASA